MTTPTKKRPTSKTKKRAAAEGAEAARQLIAALRTPHLATRKIVGRYGDDAAKLLYAAFGKFNAAHFKRKLGAPLVLITQAQSARTWGDYIARDVHGLDSRIRIAPKTVNRGERFALDVLLHEMVHAWTQEVENDAEASYRGHGPRFAAKCNEISGKLGLGEVGVKGRGGVPDCKHWPMILRPEGYYPEPFVAAKREQSGDAGDAGDEQGDAGDEQAEKVAGALLSLAALRPLSESLRGLTVAELGELSVAIDAELDAREEREAAE
jgi:hypothetical protein